MMILYRTLLLLAVATPLAGCGGLRLYSETRNAQGQAAAKAWSEVDLQADFKANAAQRQAQLALELEISDQRLASERELAIRHLASAPASAFPAFVGEELDGLLGTSSEASRAAAAGAMDQLEVKTNLQKAKRDELARTLSFLQERNAPAFTCEQLAKPTEGAVKAWKDKEKRANDFLGRKNLKQAELACADLDTLKTERAALLEGFKLGALGETQKNLRDAEDSLKQQGDEAQAKALELDQAGEAYETALEAASTGTSSTEAAAAVAEKLGKALKAVQELQTAFGDVVVSQVQIARLNAVIDHLKDGKDLGADATKAQIAITSIPTLGDDIQAIQRADKKASLVPLLMWRDMAQGRLQAAQVQVAMTQADVGLLRATVEAQLGQAQALVRSQRKLLELPTVVGAREPLYKVWDTLKNAKARVALYAALDDYLDAIGRLTQASERLRRSRYALSLEKSAALSEVNAGIWASLIAASVNQAAEFSASGVTASSLTNLITALGVLGIANGTNK